MQCIPGRVKPIPPAYGYICSPVKEVIQDVAQTFHMFLFSLLLYIRILLQITIIAKGGISPSLDFPLDHKLLFNDHGNFIAKAEQFGQIAIAGSCDCLLKTG